MNLFVRNKRVLNCFILIFTIVKYLKCATVFSSSLKNCQIQCEERNLAYPLGKNELHWTDVDTYNYTTRIHSCRHGCEDLDDRDSKCGERCSAEDIVTSACEQGCRAVLVSFLAQAQTLLVQTRVNMEVVENSMRLKWTFPDSTAEDLKELATAEIFWFAQTRPLYGNLGWRWSSLPQGSFRSGQLSAEVDVPFESSENVEVRLALSYRSQVLVSRTTTYQLPAANAGTTLELINQLQLSDDRLAVCYKTNQPTPKFKLSLITLDDFPINTEESISRCHLFTNLPKENCCKATISALDDSGSITAQIDIVLDFFVNQVENELSSMINKQRAIFTNGTHLIETEDIEQVDITDTTTSVKFPMELDDKISAINTISENKIVIGSEKGHLWLYELQLNETSEVEFEKNSDNIRKLPIIVEHEAKIKQIEYDSIQKIIYAVQHEKGIIRCKLETIEEHSCALLINSNAMNPSKKIALDPVNGFIYSINNDDKVYKTEMVAHNVTGIETIHNYILLNDLSPSQSIHFDIQKFSLISLLQNGSIVSWNPISDQIHQLRDFVSMEGVRNFRIIESKIYYNDKKCDENDTDLVCIYAENLHPVEEEKPYKYKYSSSLLDVIFLKDPLLKPRIAAVKTISLLVSDKIGRITWNAGRNPPFQAQNRLWRNTTFLLKVTSPEGGDEASPIEIYTDVNDVRIDLKPGIKYRAQVQTCSNDFCSSPITTSNTALEDLEKQIPFVFIKKKQDDIEAIDIIGDVIEVDESVHNLAKFTYPYVLDNTTRTVYMAGDHSMGIYKKELGDTQGPPKPFKDGLFVEMLSIMPSRAIIVIASSYRIVSYRLPTTFDYELYTCEEPLEACAEVMGISSDDTSGEIYFLTQSRNGSVSLYKSKDYATSFVSSTLTLPPLRRFLMVGDKMILVTKTGHIVQTDKSLSVINVAFQLVRVEKIIPIRYDSNFHKIEFTDDIKFSDDSKKNLLWSISPPTDFGGVLYKVMLFRDKMGLEAPIVNVQVDSNYTIPAEILDQWSSAQRFDISVQAITPWTSTMLNRTGLLAPIKPPTPPTQLRIYATQQKTVDGPRALISFFWSAPLEWNGTPYQYIVNCTKEDGTWIGGPVTTSQSHYSFAVKSGKVSCCAAAANEPVNVGSFSDTISIDSSELKPLVKLFAIDSTSSLIAINDLAGKEEVRSSKKKRQIAQPTRLEYYALAFIGEDLYAVRKEGDSAQPVLVQIDTNHIENTLHKVSIGGDVTRIDAMTSDWVGHRLLFAAGTILYQLPLEPFQSTSLLNPSKVIQLTAATDAKQLTYDPFKNTAYLLTKNGSLFALDLNKGTEENLALSISCLSSQTITWMMAEFTWNRASSPKIYALTWNGLISVDVAEENQCNEVRIDWTKFGEKGLKAISSFAIADKLFAFVTSSEMLIYGKDVVTPIPIANPPLKQILAVSQSSQPYPDRSCFELPSSKGIAFNIINEGKTGAYLEVNRSTSAPNACQDISMPLTQYEIYFTRKNTDKVKHVRSFTDRIHVENGILDKETDYDVTVSWLNRYSPGSGVSVVKSFRTGFGYPSAPRDPHAIPVTPDTVYLYWNLPETLNAPISEIKYQISQQAAGLASPISIAVTPLSDGVASNTSSDSAACLINPCRVKIANLRASNEYKFWITATHISHIDNSLFNDEEAVSTEATARTLDIPGTLRPDNVTGSSLLLRWNGLEPETFPTSVSVQFKESGEINDWQTPDTNATFEPSVTSEIVLIRNLLSATSYDYRFVATYTGTYTVDGKVLAYKEDYYQIAQQARTKAGVPTQPQAVEARFDADGWILTWKEPMSDGGSPITSYAVETRVNKTAEWEIAERGLDGWKSWWRPGKTDNTPSDLEFRIRAANIEGFGPYAYIEQQEKESEEAESNMTLLIVILLLIVVALAIILLVFMWLKTYREQQIKKREAQDEQNCIRLDVVTNLTFSPIHPLPPEINNEIKNLPHINKKVVTISSFLSEGSYGSIHKGIASEVPLSWEKNIKVAVKSLKEDYSYHDKVIFMKEAILLNNIDHPNIVKLHGVCLTQGSEFIILELMQGGVLLSFLRDSVPTENQPSELCLRDLLSFAVDIARGMNYLERLPHVQRDLSARKCLLSERIGPNRVTKLEVSISKNLVNPNMTKAELEGNDQVRWMAPETLKELTFTSKTDVWSFGVLLYEIFSLGEEPFIEKNNKKVITDVREGIILPKPMYCLDRLYKLMQQCWAYEPSKRPNFATILKIFESFRERVEFQDDKPFQYHDNHFNGAFDISHDSTSSERIESRPPPSPSNLNKSFGGFDNQAYEHMDKIEISAKKNGVAARSLRKEKTKFRNVQGSADDTDQRIFRPLSIHSTDTISTDYGASSSLNSPSRSNPLALQAGYIFDNGTKTRLSASPGLGNANDGFVGSQSLNSSKSWNLMSGDVQQNPNGLQSTPQHSNSAGTLRPRLETLPSSRNRQSRHNRVSQV